jgi:hypothetical protein
MISNNIHRIALKALDPNGNKLEINYESISLLIQLLQLGNRNSQNEILKLFQTEKAI